MLFKLALRNVRRQISSYMIYFITVVFTVSLMFAVNNVLFSAKLHSMSDVAPIKPLLLIIVLFITLVVGFIISYATKFLLRKRKKELGIYMLLGIGRMSVLKIFVIENLIIGFASFLLGCLLGLGVFQILNAIVCAIMGHNFPPLGYAAAGLPLTLAQWAAIFLGAVLFSGNFLRKTRINDLISDKKTVGKPLKKHVSLIIKTTLTVVFLALMGALVAAEVWLFKDEAGEKVLGDVAHTFLIPLGAVALIACLYFIPKNRIAERILSYVMLAVIAAAGAVLIWMPLEDANFWHREAPLVGITTHYYLIAVSGIVMAGAIFLFYYFSRGRYAKKLRYGGRAKGGAAKKFRGSNVFYYRQMTSALNANGVIMGVVAVLLSFSFFFTNYSFSTRYAEIERINRDNPFDVSSYWQYNDINPFVGSPDEVLADAERYAKVTFSHEFGLYHSAKRDDEKWYSKGEPSYFIARAGDFNTLLEAMGRDTYTVPDGGYYLLRDNIAYTPAELAYLQDNPLTVYGKARTLAGVTDESSYDIFRPGGGRSYEYFIVLPDDALAAGEWAEYRTHEGLILNTQGYLPPEFYNKYAVNSTDFNCRYRALDRSNAQFSFIIVASLFLSVSFMFIAMALLALKIMADADIDKKRYKVLGLLGLSKGERRKLLFRQIFAFFALPLLLPLCVAGVAVAFGGINAYLMLGYVPAAVFVIGTVVPLIYAGIFACYFAATYFLSAQSNITATEKNNIKLLSRGNNGG